MLGPPTTLELFYAPTPNGWKITILLHEADIPYTLVPIDLSKGEQFEPEFVKCISPNSKMPGIRARWKNSDKIVQEICVFESGAIMMLLAELYPEKIQPFYNLKSQNLQYRKSVLEWLFWVNANLGPIAGQVSHFIYYAPRLAKTKDYDHSYALSRYKAEYDRLIGVLDKRLQETNNGYIIGGPDEFHDDPSSESDSHYSIVDMAA